LAQSLVAFMARGGLQADDVHEAPCTKSGGYPALSRHADASPGPTARSMGPPTPPRSPHPGSRSPHPGSRSPRAPSPSIEARNTLLQQRVVALEQELRERDELLAGERERSARAKKKVKQLLAKLTERDEVIGGLRSALKEARALNEQAVNMQRQLSPPDRRRGSLERRRQSSVEASQENAIRERADIVKLLEGHLTQMRMNLAESEREVRELEEKKLAKEVEWNQQGGSGSGGASSSQVHFQRLGMIEQQLQQKRRFSAELTRKTKQLEEQLLQQRTLIDDLKRSVSPDGEASLSDEPADLDAVGGKDGVFNTDPLPQRRPSADHTAAPSDFLPQRRPSADYTAAPRVTLVQQLTKSPGKPSNDALDAFLAAAGEAAEVITSRPDLKAAFEGMPLEFTAAAVEGCTSEERAQALSLFAAWAGSASESPQRAMHLSDFHLQLEDVQALDRTFRTCGAVIEEWEMTRCPASESLIRSLLGALSGQPLRRLNLGYDALGPVGAVALVGAAGSWSATLEDLSLEMNGLGDAGCNEIAKMISGGALPSLRSLELGWNELSAGCAASLSRLIPTAAIGSDADGGDDAVCTTSKLCKLGLSGNKLGLEGAETLVVAVLSQPGLQFELDLSMNHVGGAGPLLAMSDWAEKGASTALAVTINLEWNTIDDDAAVRRFAEAIGKADLKPPPDAMEQLPLLRLANNDELHELDPAEITRISQGLVCC